MIRELYHDVQPVAEIARRERSKHPTVAQTSKFAAKLNLASGAELVFEPKIPKTVDHGGTRKKTTKRKKNTD